MSRNDGFTNTNTFMVALTSGSNTQYVSDICGHFCPLCPLMKKLCGHWCPSFRPKWPDKWAEWPLLKNKWAERLWALAKYFKLIANKKGCFGVFWPIFSAHKLLGCPSCPLTQKILTFKYKRKKYIYRDSFLAGQVGSDVALTGPGHKLGQCPRILYMGYNERNRMSLTYLALHFWDSRGSRG